MTTAEDEKWNRALELSMPLMGIALSALSLTLGIVTLTRAASSGRAYYLDGQYLVSVRYPGQRHALREFVQPNDLDVAAVYSEVGSNATALFDFVCRNINYKSDWGEYWQFPRETLSRRLGDCEDTSILLASLLRNFTDAQVALGEYQGYGHAWVLHEGEILETTYSSARRISDPANYIPYAYFDDRDIIEVWPGALAEMFEVAKDENAKLDLMAKVPVYHA